MLEVRYNGSHTIHQWLSVNTNEVNVFENGFLTQFKAAQQNLKINEQHNINSFADNGYPGQTQTPIFNAAFAGRVPRVQACRWPITATPASSTI